MIMFEGELAKAEYYQSGNFCLRMRKSSGPNGFYACVRPTNRTVSFRQTKTAPWAPAVRCCHICALELCGDEGDSRDQAILLGA